MFCKFCGAQIPDGSESCPSCKGSISKAAPSVPKPEPTANTGSAVKEIADNFTSIAMDKTAGLPRVLIAKVCILIALVSFFLPFISVSCTQEKSTKESYSGFRLMLSIDKDDDEVASNSDSDPKPNIFLIAAFAGGVAAAVFIFRNKKYKIAAITSGVAAIALILFRMTFLGYYDVPDEVRKYIEVDTKIGLLLCILMMLTTAAACFLENKNSESGNGTL